MSKLPQVSGKETVRALEKMGFLVIQQRGSHIKMERTIADQVQRVIVPNHKEVAIGTFQSILKQAGLTKKEFEGFIK